jgi:uncharacterized protein
MPFNLETGDRMKVVRNALLALLFTSTAVMAAPASDAAIKQLLSVTQAQRVIEAMRSNLDSVMNNAIQQALQGKTPTPAQQQAIARMKKRMVGVMKEELAWEKLEPIYLRLYKDSFTEEEIAGMLAFYKTPAGQAVIYKMPGLMQKTMQEVQKTVAGLSPQMQKIQQDFVAEMTAAGK